MDSKDDKVVILDVITRLDIPAERILEQAIKHGMEDVVISGHDKNGEFYFASSIADGAQSLWLLERSKHKLMMMADELEDEK